MQIHYTLWVYFMMLNAFHVNGLDCCRVAIIYCFLPVQQLKLDWEIYNGIANIDWQHCLFVSHCLSVFISLCSVRLYQVSVSTLFHCRPIRWCHSLLTSKSSIWLTLCLARAWWVNNSNNPFILHRNIRKFITEGCNWLDFRNFISSQRQL